MDTSKDEQYDDVKRGKAIKQICKTLLPHLDKKGIKAKLFNENLYIKIARLYYDFVDQFKNELGNPDTNISYDKIYALNCYVIGILRKFYFDVDIDTLNNEQLTYLYRLNYIVPYQLTLSICEEHNIKYKIEKNHKIKQKQLDYLREYLIYLPETKDKAIFSRQHIIGLILYASAIIPITSHIDESIAITRQYKLDSFKLN